MSYRAANPRRHSPQAKSSPNDRRAPPPNASRGSRLDGAGKFLLVYVAGPVIGALLAAFAYRFIVISPAGKVEERPIDTLA